MGVAATVVVAVGDPMPYQLTLPLVVLPLVVVASVCVVVQIVVFAQVFGWLWFFV